MSQGFCRHLLFTALNPNDEFTGYVNSTFFVKAPGLVSIRPYTPLLHEAIKTDPKRSNRHPELCTYKTNHNQLPVSCLIGYSGTECHPHG